MNVASLELCKELYELSGWDDPQGFYMALNRRHRKKPDEVYYEQFFDGQEHNGYAESPEFVRRGDVPAYDLGYLFRMLPDCITLDKCPNGDYLATCRVPIDGRIENDVFDHWYTESAVEPEDAACKLAIQIFKQGVLARREATT